MRSGCNGFAGCAACSRSRCGRARARVCRHQVQRGSVELKHHVLHDDGFAEGRHLVLARRFARQVDRHGEAVVEVSLSFIVRVHDISAMDGHGKQHIALPVLCGPGLLDRQVTNHQRLVVLIEDVVRWVAKGLAQKAVQSLSIVFRHFEVR